MNYLLVFSSDVNSFLEAWEELCVNTEYIQGRVECAVLD